MTSRYKVGDVVRVLHTDYPDDFKVGQEYEVAELGDEGVDLAYERADGTRGCLYFYDHEVELAGAPTLASNSSPLHDDLDAIIAKLERIKALREGLGLVAA